MTVTFGVLGPLTAETAAGPVTLRGNRQRAILARLLIADGRVVPVGTLVDDLWPSPPDRAVASVRTFVADLRRALEPGRPPRWPSELLVTVPPGYALHAPSVDAADFTEAVHAALDLPPADALARLDAALALWRGPAYAEFAAEGWARAAVDRLDELRALAVERQARALLDLSRPADAVPSLQAHTAAHPLREDAWHLLATALYRAGRQADALAALRRARATLAGRHGIDPGPRLRTLESDILTHATHLQDHEPSAVRPDTPFAPARNTRAAPPARDLPPPTTAPPADRPHPADTTTFVDQARPAARHPDGTTTFVGRAGERDRLLAAAATAEQDRRPVLALISGDAGAGKTALAEALTTALASAGWTTVWGRCPEYEGAPVAWPWLQVTEALSTTAEAAATAPGNTGDGPGGGGGADPAAARFRLRQAAAALVSAAAARAPVLIVLDDLHRADEGTLDLLAGLLGGPGAASGPVLVAGTYRATEITPELGAALARFARAEPVRVDLGGLPSAATGDLATSITGRDLGPEVVERLHRRTGGNPFFVRELARVLATDGVDALGSVPAGVRDVIRHRLTRLPAPARAVLQRAAVLGRDVDPDVLAALAGTDGDGLLDALDHAITAGLLAEVAGLLRFTHILVRDTVYGDLSALRRARWHAAAGAALERLRPDDPGPLAHHFALAGPASARPAARYARIAAEQAERRGNAHEAARLWQLAVDAHDRTPVPGGAPQRAAARAEGLRARLVAVLGLGRALAVTGRLAQARRHRADAIELAESLGDPVAAAIALTSFDVPAVWPRNDDEELSARIVAAAGRTLAAWDRGVPAPAVPHGADHPPAGAGGASGRTGGDAVLLRSRLLSTMALELRGGTGDRGGSAAREAERLARAAGQPEPLAFALNARFIHCFGRAGLSRERAAIGAELVALAARHRLVTYEVLGHLILVQSSCAHGDTTAADRHAVDADRLADRYDLPMVGIFTGWYAGLRHALHGDPGAAETAYRAAASRTAGSGMTGVEDGLLSLALLSLRLGSPAPDWSDVEHAGPEEPWVRPLRLIRQGHTRDAAVALREVPESPRDLLLEARLWLVARAAAELGENGVLARAREALRPADGELAGGGSGILSFGRIRLGPPAPA